MIAQTRDTQYIYDLLTTYALTNTPVTNVIQPYLPQVEDTRNSFFRALALYVGGLNETTTPEQIAQAYVVTREVKLLIFYYSVEDLYEEVLKRTAYVAKSRRDKELQTHLLDVVAMTRDDKPMFDPYLADACTRALDSLKAFTRNVQNAFLFQQESGIPAVENKTYLKGDRVLSSGEIFELTGVDQEVVTEVENGFDTTNWTELPGYLYTNDKVEFVILQPEWYNQNMNKTADVSIFETLIHHVMYKWFTVVFPEEAAYYLQESERYAKQIISAVNTSNRPMVRKYRMF